MKANTTFSIFFFLIGYCWGNWNSFKKLSGFGSSFEIKLQTVVQFPCGVSKEGVKPYFTSFLKILLKFLKSFRRYEGFPLQYYLTFPCYTETNDVSIKRFQHFFIFNLYTMNSLFKACVRYFLRHFYSSPNDRPSKTTKDNFYFI